MDDRINVSYQKEEVEVKDILYFCKQWRSRKEIVEQFKLNSGQLWRTMQWLMKANLIKQESACNLNVKVDGRQTFYKTK